MPSGDSRLLRARRFIDDCFDQPIDLERMAREANVSRFHFLRLFREAYQITPHQYLQERRIERAKQLLIAGHFSVTDVCFEVGFESLGSFSTLFRRTVGESPASYRTRPMVRVPERPGIQFPNPQFFVPYCFALAAKGALPPPAATLTGGRGSGQAQPFSIAEAAAAARQGSRVRP